MDIEKEVVYTIYHEGFYYRTDGISPYNWQRERRKGGWVCVDRYDEFHGKELPKLVSALDEFILGEQ